MKPGIPQYTVLNRETYDLINDFGQSGLLYTKIEVWLTFPVYILTLISRFHETASLTPYWKTYLGYFGVFINTLPRCFIRVHIRLKNGRVPLIFNVYTVRIGLENYHAYRPVNRACIRSTHPYLHRCDHHTCADRSVWGLGSSVKLARP